MHKFLLWTTYVSSALAALNQVISVDKRQSGSSDDGVIKVMVGANGNLTYSPDSLDNLPVGTIIEFDFFPKNHTVTESSFDVPCHPIGANVTLATKGRLPLKTGFVPVNASDQFTRAFRYQLNDTKPMWIYCGQVSHCQKGMVMVINQNASDTVHTLDNYRAAAAQVPLPGASSSSSSAPASSSTAGGVNPVSAPSSTSATDGPTLAASATASTSSSVGTFNGAAPSVAVPMALAALVATFAVMGSPLLFWI